MSVIYGSGEGLTGDFDDLWHQDLATLEGAAEPGDFFGSSLAIGDFDGNSVALWRGNGLGLEPQTQESLGASLAAGQFTFVPGDELAIGAPGRDIPGADGAGVVLLISDVDGSVFSSEWSQESDDVPGVAEDFDRFGSSLASGDFDGDGIDELAV